MKQTGLPYTQNEAFLVAAASRGDLDAFNELVLQYQDAVYRHACFILDDPYLAEDITQETFIKAFQYLGSFRGGSFRAWLLRIVTNASFDSLRSSRRIRTTPLFPEDKDGKEIESPAWLADPSSSVQATIERKEDANVLKELLMELPVEYRTVLTLIDLYEFDYQETAETLKVPLGTIKSRLARARMRMQQKIITQGRNDVYRSSSAVATAY